MEEALKARRIQPLVALRAVRALIRDKEDTAQAFRASRALQGKSSLRNFERFRASDAGTRILDEQRELIAALRDRAWLASLRGGSLGRAYLDFIEREGISADGLEAASLEGEMHYPKHEDYRRFVTRLRDMHDLWHVVTGYGRDGLGEDCLLAFSFAQTRNWGLGLIVLLGTLHISRSFPGARIWPLVREAYGIGRRAAWLPGADWEHLLTRPLGEVRETLGLARPARYLSSGELIAATRDAYGPA